MDKNCLTFCDVFSGCGGLSLGLVNAGLKGIFVIEKSRDAFNTLKVNLIEPFDRESRFSWPSWLPIQPFDISEFIEQYYSYIIGRRGEIDVLAGGPPCQGFSLAGRRAHADPRNQLFSEYLKLVEILNPRFIVFENVQGFSIPFKVGTSDKPFSHLINRELAVLGYKPFQKIIDLSEYGIPQVRRRFFLIAIRSDDRALDRLNNCTPFDIMDSLRVEFLRNKGLSAHNKISAKEAIGDLEIIGSELIENSELNLKGFKQIKYNSARYTSDYIVHLRNGSDTAPCSLRLPNHSPRIKTRFREIIRTCVPGRVISKDNRERLGIRKKAITLLSESLPSATITTLPDDIIHYSEPRILTARETARLQTFPDWFKFTGNYTTGGKNRVNECPRYTQIGNAVPPLFAELIGLTLKKLSL